MASEAKPLKPGSGRRAVAAALLVAVACAGLAVRISLRRSAVIAAIPARPDISALPQGFDDDLGAAERLAHSLLHSEQGLARISSLYHANNFYDEAMQCYRALRALDPRDARWPHLEASILGQFGRQDDAIEREQVAVDLDPGYLPARLRLGDELLIANRRADARRVYNQVLERSPDNPYAELGIAKADLLDGDWQATRARLEDCAKKNPDFVGGLETLAAAYEHLGDQPRAEELKATIGRREFVDLRDPWIDALMNDCFDSYRLSIAAAVADFAGDRPASEGMLERAIAFAPTKSSFHRQLAVKLALDNDLVSACQHLERAVAIDPSDNDAWLLLAQYRKVMGQEAAAEQAVRSGLVACPDSAGLHMEEAKRLAAAGRNEEAIAEFRESYRLNPSETAPLVELAGIFISTGRGDDAVAALTQALDKQPEDPEALATLTFYYVRSGDEARALEWWSHVKRQPRTPPGMVASVKEAFQQRFGRPIE